MRLLIMSSSTERGGAEEYVLTIATGAIARDWDVHVGLPKAEGTASFVTDLTNRGSYYHQLNIAEGKVYPFRWLDYLVNFIRSIVLLLKVRPNLVEINLPAYGHCFCSLMACALLNIPTVAVFHLFPDRAKLHPIKLKLYHWARSRNQHWIGVSEHNCKIIRDSFETDPSEVRCIYNGAKVTAKVGATQIEAARQSVRAELGLAADSQIALTVGRLADQKGYVDLIPTIPHLIQEFPKLKFVWVGDGDQQEELINLLETYQVRDRVLFLGYRTDVIRLLQSADLFVFPSRHEGQPFALLEAMAQGLAIVASDTCGIPEVLTSHVQGILFRTQDSCDLLEALRWALRHPDQMAEMAKQAEVRVQSFTEERMVNETLSLFTEIANVQSMLPHYSTPS